MNMSTRHIVKEHTDQRPTCRGPGNGFAAKGKPKVPSRLRSTIERKIKEERDFAEAVLDTVQEAILVLDANLVVHNANRSFYQAFQVTPRDTVHHFIYDLGNKQWDIPQLRHLLERVLPQSTRFDGFQIKHRFEH